MTDEDWDSMGRQLVEIDKVVRDTETRFASEQNPGHFEPEWLTHARMNVVLGHAICQLRAEIVALRRSISEARR